MDHWRRRQLIKRLKLFRINKRFRALHPIDRKIPVFPTPEKNYHWIWGDNGYECHPPPKTFYSAEGFGRALRKRGFKLVGSGYFSKVYAKENNPRVIKVSANDGGWMDYIKWASKEGYAGTLAPKVFSYKWIKGTKEDFAVSVMERLKSFALALKEDNDNALVPTLFEWATKHNNGLAAKAIDLVSPGLKDFGVKLKAEFKDCSLDLHAGNFMLRNDNSVVVIDPISGSSRPTITERYRSQAA